MTSPRLSCIRLTAPMQPRLVVEAKKRPHSSVVEAAANSTDASCSGACSRKRICARRAGGRGGWMGRRGGGPGGRRGVGS